MARNDITSKLLKKLYLKNEGLQTKYLTYAAFSYMADNLVEFATTLNR